MGKFKNLKGQTFGRLTVVEDSGQRISGAAIWICKCECGKEARVRSGHLNAGYTISCGCFRRDIKTIHGMAGTSTYNTWIAMHDRCSNNKNKRWKHYGGRGIKVCEKWNTFEGFFEDLGIRPVGKSLDRLDVNGNYEPGNCEWRTSKEQGRNTRLTIYLTNNGETLSLRDWAERAGLKYATVYKRFKLGESPERVLRSKEKL